MSEYENYKRSIDAVVTLNKNHHKNSIQLIPIHTNSKHLLYAIIIVYKKLQIEENIKEN